MDTNTTASTTASTPVMQTPPTGPASCALEPGSYATGPAVRGTGLPFAGRIKVTHAAVVNAWFAGGARSTDLLGHVPRGAPV